MTRLDFSPLNALTVGFDQVLNNLAKIPTFPPYNIEKTEEGTYKLTFAVAGFSKDFVEVKLKDNLLSVRGTMPKADNEKDFLWRGIAERNFSTSFKLADYMNVLDAKMEDGILSIDLKQEIPEEKKEKNIKVN